MDPTTQTWPKYELLRGRIPPQEILPKSAKSSCLVTPSSQLKKHRSPGISNLAYTRWCRSQLVFYDAALPNGAWQHATCYPRRDVPQRADTMIPEEFRNLFFPFFPRLIVDDKMITICMCIYIYCIYIYSCIIYIYMYMIYM